MCLCDGEFPKDTAFIFLDDLCDKLFDTFTEDEIKENMPYAKIFTDKYTPIMKDKMLYYNRNPEASDSLKQLKREVLQYRDNVVKSYGDLIDRGERISLVVKKADSLKHESGVYYSGSKKVRRAARCRKIMIYAFIIVILLLIAFFIFTFICGAFDYSCLKGDDSEKKEEQKLMRFLESINVSANHIMNKYN